MVSLVRAISRPFNSMERLLWHLFQRRSSPPDSGFRFLSDTIPGQLGHHSNGARKLSGLSPEHCPISIGTVSGQNRNAVRQKLESVSDSPRNTHQTVTTANLTYFRNKAYGG